MSTAKPTPYGGWRSPISSDLIVAQTIRLGNSIFANHHVYWTELRPQEGGRSVVVRRSPNGQTQDINPAPFNARTRVHEYGGRPFAVLNDTLFFSNYEDQRLYRCDPGSAPYAITPDDQLRYADYLPDPQRNLLYCVREDHRQNGEAINTLVAINCDTDSQGGRVLASGSDFYASPRLCPDGRKLAWLSWDHPNMPFDGTQLWIGTLSPDGALRDIEQVAGGPEESIFQPEWSPDGILHFVSDRSGWWNLYSLEAGQIRPLCPMEAEFGLPQWVFGMSTYAFAGQEQIICTYIQQGQSKLARLDRTSLVLEEIPTPYTDIAYLDARPNQALFIGGSPNEADGVLSLDLASGHYQTLGRSNTLKIDPECISPPQSIQFPTEDGLTAFAFYYPPRNPEHRAPDNEKPPLLVKSHGGPTGATTSTLDLKIQYWTSRGIAVLDINYGGSTGYGRAYRQRLKGRWGIVDVDDCVNGALYLVQQGLADSERLMIAGGSAGGYTTLAALTFRRVFKAGASHYGVSDLESLATDTHKFEARYLDNLIGPYPANKDLYQQRSPIHFTEKLSCPLIFFQGLEDKVVPPDQAEKMFDAVRAKGLPTAHLTFAGEGHGFRNADNIKRALDAELYFYAKVFGFPLADPIEPVPIENI